MIEHLIDRVRRRRMAATAPAPPVLQSSRSTEPLSWRTSAPMPVSSERRMGTQQGLGFVRGLSTRSTPAVLRPMSHEVSRTGPIGVVRSIAVLAQPGTGAGQTGFSIPTPSAATDGGWSDVEVRSEQPFPEAGLRPSTVGASPATPLGAHVAVARKVPTVASETRPLVPATRPELPKPFARPRPFATEARPPAASMSSNQPLVPARSVIRPAIGMIARPLAPTTDQVKAPSPGRSTDLSLTVPPISSVAAPPRRSLDVPQSIEVQQPPAVPQSIEVQQRLAGPQPLEVPQSVEAQRLPENASVAERGSIPDREPGSIGLDATGRRVGIAPRHGRGSLGPCASATPARHTRSRSSSRGAQSRRRTGPDPESKPESASEAVEPGRAFARPSRTAGPADDLVPGRGRRVGPWRRSCGRRP